MSETIRWKETVKKKKQKLSRKESKLDLLRISWRHQVKVFFQNSTLHGVRYIAEDGRPAYENVMWFVFVSGSTVVTLLIIVSLWEKFQTNPTITGLDTDFHNWDVPFPGLSVCPDRPYNLTRFQEYINKKWGENLPEQKSEYYAGFISLISNLSYSNLNEILKYENVRRLPQDDFRKLTYEVAAHCEEVLTDCFWKGEEYKCCSGFFPTFTENGFCYSFNTLHSETDWLWKENMEKVESKIHYIYETDTKWTMEFNGFANASENPYNNLIPWNRRRQYMGFQDLNILFQTILNLSTAETVFSNTVDLLVIYIHSSDELPGVEMSPQLVWSKTISKMFFAARTTYTTEDARQLSPKQRKCIFEDEVKLKTADKYSYWACMTDCRMRAALELCNCVPHFHHKADGFPYCGLQGLICLAKHIDEIKNTLNCPCELGCMNTVYEVEKLNNAGNEGEEPLEIGFVSWPMIRYKREVLFGWVDLLVAFGGIAGLFLGFSLLSGVEIIYYFTLRACCMVYQDPETLRKIKEEKENSKKKKKVYSGIDSILNPNKIKSKYPVKFNSTPKNHY